MSVENSRTCHPLPAPSSALIRVILSVAKDLSQVFVFLLLPLSPPSSPRLHVLCVNLFPPFFLNTYLIFAILRDRFTDHSIAETIFADEKRALRRSGLFGVPIRAAARDSSGKDRCRPRRQRCGQLFASYLECASPAPAFRMGDAGWRILVPHGGQDEGPFLLFSRTSSRLVGRGAVSQSFHGYNKDLRVQRRGNGSKAGGQRTGEVRHSAAAERGR